MPCGGIYPLKGTEVGPHVNLTDPHSHCFVCGKQVPSIENALFCDEWDCVIHRECVFDFLKTKEGEIVLAHEHQVILYWEGHE